MSTPNVRENDDTAVVAKMDFCIPGEKVIFYPGDRARSHWPYRPHEVVIRDARAVAGELELERNGFVLVERPSAVKDFYDPEEVERVYIPEVIALVKELTGADKTITFGTMIRSDAASRQHNLPAFGAHVDYGDRTVRECTKDILGEEEAERRLRGRYVLINVWRPIKVVHRAPFAVCDASTVAASDLNDSEVHGGLGDANRPPLYGYSVSFNPNQRWYYVPQMRPQEVLVFKLFDSDSSRVQWAAHSAFEHPNTAPDAPPRESIEIRTISFFAP